MLSAGNFGRPRTENTNARLVRKDLPLLVRAFQLAWSALLRDERITAQNIEGAGAVLMRAIVEAADDGERDELILCDSGLAAVARFERDELEKILDTTPRTGPLH